MHLCDSCFLVSTRGNHLVKWKCSIIMRSWRHTTPLSKVLIEIKSVGLQCQQKWALRISAMEKSLSKLRFGGLHGNGPWDKPSRKCCFLEWFVSILAGTGQRHARYPGLKVWQCQWWNTSVWEYSWTRFYLLFSKFSIYLLCRHSSRDISVSPSKWRKDRYNARALSCWTFFALLQIITSYHIHQEIKKIWFFSSSHLSALHLKTIAMFPTSLL